MFLVVIRFRNRSPRSDASAYSAPSPDASSRREQRGVGCVASCPEMTVTLPCVKHCVAYNSLVVNARTCDCY